MVLKKSEILQRDVWMFDPNPVKGHEQGTKQKRELRPCVVISNDNFNNGHREMVIIVPCTTADSGIPSHIEISPPEGGLSKTSFAMAEQVRSISHIRLKKKKGAISEQTLVKIQSWIIDLLDLDL